jgi:hypothetical protein
VTALPPLVGLIGKKRVGKDTFAAVLVEEFGFARVAFADPLKEMALTIDPLLPSDGLYTYHLAEAVDDLGWEHVKDTYPEARRFLQRLGDGVRQFDEDFWVAAGMQEASSNRAEGFPVVITDVRYPNEADAIREAGGTLVRITRPGVDDGDTHASETALVGYETEEEFHNASSVSDLKDWVRALAQIELGL